MKRFPHNQPSISSSHTSAYLSHNTTLLWSGLFMGSNMVPNVWCVESINISCANFIWWLQWLVGHSFLCSLVLLIRKLRSYNIFIFAFFIFDCLDYNWLFSMSLVIFRLYAYCYTSLSSPHRNFTLLFYLIIKVMCSHCKKN